MFAPRIAVDGMDGLEKQLAGSFDLVITDVEMPRMDGFELTRNVRGDSRMKSVPIIMITSRTADKHRNYAAELGVKLALGQELAREDAARMAALIGKKVDATVQSYPEIYQARRLGMSAISVIHPNQIEEANAAFTPAKEDIEYAAEVVKAFEIARDAGQGAVAFRGQLLDYPIVDRARQTLELARSLGVM